MPKTDIQSKTKSLKDFRETVQRELRQEADRLEREAAHLREAAMAPRNAGESE